MKDHFSMRVKVVLLVLSICLTLTDRAAAETISCPDMGIALKAANPNMPSRKVSNDYIRDIHSGSVNCEYGPKNRILLSWFSSLNQEMWDNKCGERRSAAEEITVKFDKKRKWIILTSKSRLSLVYIWLSPKEYRKRRDDWAAAGRKLLQEHISRGMSCEVYEPYVPTRARPESPAVPSRPSEPPAAPKRYAPTQQGRDPNPSHPAETPQMEKPAPEPAAQPDNVDEKIDDILERLKGG